MSINHTTQDIIEDGESSQVEFVASPDALEHVARAACAMLNTRGGTVIVGYDESSNTAGTVSQQKAKKLEKYLREEITPQVPFSVCLDEIDQGQVITVEVPKGSDRPFVFEGSVYTRKGASVVKADAQTMRQMVDDDTRDGPRWERLSSPSISLDELDEKLVARTINSAIKKRGLEFVDRTDHAQVLQELALSQFGQLTNAADVVFGKKVALRHPQIRVRAVTYETDRAADFVDEQLFEGPALTLVDVVMTFLRRHVAIANEFKPDQIARETKPSYPFYSLREGLVNALAHRDYSSFSGSVSVSVYPQQIQIWNTGKLPKGLTPRKLVLAEHDSVLVNPDIAHVFFLNEFMERLGRGTFNIVQECREFQMHAPKWENTGAGVRLTFHAATSSIDAIDELNDRQVALLRSLKEGDRIQSSEFVSKFAPDVSQRQARRDLSELTAMGFLSRVGSGPSSAFKRTERGFE